MQRNKLTAWFCSETFCIITISFVFLCSFTRIIISKTHVLSHDSIEWYGLFQYFCDSFFNGYWPFWNPYTHVGEPFYYNYAQFPLLEPVMFIGILTGKFLRADILTLYHWIFLIQLLCMNIGTYLFLRRFYNHRFTRVVLFIIITFSSVSLISLRLLGILQVFYWAPWILFVLFRWFEDKKLFNWILLSTFTGLSFCQYGVVYSLFFVFVLMMTFFLKNKVNLKRMLPGPKRKNLKLIFLSFVIVVALSSPLWTTALFDINKIVPVARTLDGITKGFLISLEEIQTANPSARNSTMLQDFPGLINPYFPHAFLKGWYGNIFNGAVLTESFLYIGILPLFLAIYGIIFSRHRYKLNFLILLIVTGTVMLGPKCVFFKVFFYIFPLMRFTRYPMQFFPFFLLTLYYFAGLGIDHVLYNYEKLKTGLRSGSVKLPFISQTLILKLLSVFGIFFVICFLTNKFSMEIRYLIYFYGLCAVFFLLLKRALTIARFGKLIIGVFIVTDLFIFNYANRPLMYLERDVPFSTEAQVPQLTERVLYSEISEVIPRFTSLLFRRASVQKNVDNPSKSTFFELKNFNVLTSIPNNNLKVVTGVSEPTIRMYYKAIPYKEQHLDRYFKDPGEEDTLRNVLFINDKAVDEELLYDPGHEGEISLDNSFDYRMLSYNPSDIRIEVSTKDKGFLYFSDGYDDCWNAYVDSKPVDLYRANINFKAVIVPPGTHTVRFVYKPTFHILALVSYFSAILTVVVFLWYLAIQSHSFGTVWSHK